MLLRSSIFGGLRFYSGLESAGLPSSAPSSWTSSFSDDRSSISGAVFHVVIFGATILVVGRKRAPIACRSSIFVV